MAQKKVTDIKEVDKSKSLDNALGQIERQFGSGTVMRMGEKRHERIIRYQSCYRYIRTLKSTNLSKIENK